MVHPGGLYNRAEVVLLLSSVSTSGVVVDDVSPGFLLSEAYRQLRDVAHPRPAPAIGEHTDEILAELDG
jgi:hypothetical protein